MSTHLDVVAEFFSDYKIPPARWAKLLFTFIVNAEVSIFTVIFSNDLVSPSTTATKNLSQEISLLKNEERGSFLAEFQLQMHYQSCSKSITK